jgi:hypothetical protein
MRLWLFSNRPSFAHHPFPIDLSPGMQFWDKDAPDPFYQPECRPLIGMAALRRSGLTLHIDFTREMVTVRTPAPWYRSVTSAVRRVGERLMPIEWAYENPPRTM